MRLPAPAHGFLVLALLAFASGLAGCSGSKRMGTSGPTGELPDQEVTDFVLTETDLGRPQWTLYARSASTFTARNLTVVRGVRVDFFDEQGARSSELTAREGEIQQQTRDMTARGSVLLQTAEGTRMATEELHYLNGQNQITSDKLVRVERKGDVLEGIGFRGDPEMHHFELREKVRATVRAGTGAQLENKGGSK